MKASYNLFVRELTSLKQFIIHQNEGVKLLNKLKKEKLIDKNYKDFNVAKRKIYNYNTYIITLYGFFERYIENLLTQYLNELSDSSISYNSLPNVIKINNVQKNSELLLNLSLPKYKDIDPKSLISVLNSNLMNDVPKLYPQAFAQHRSNFRHQFVSEFFKNIGINNLSQEIRNYSPLKDRLEAEFFGIKSQKASILFTVINDLAERRNDIAHGVENIEVLHPNMVINYIDFILDYGSSLYQHILDRLIEYKYINKTLGIEKIGVIRNEILLCRLNKIPLNMNSKIIVKRRKTYPKYLIAGIKEIQIDNKRMTQIDGNKDLNVGVNLDVKINLRHSFKLLC